LGPIEQYLLRRSLDNWVFSIAQKIARLKIIECWTARGIFEREFLSGIFLVLN